MDDKTHLPVQEPANPLDEAHAREASGSKPGYPTINLMQEKDGTWRAAALFTSVTVVPHLSSASIPAALRNLRGHLGNLAIDLDKLGIKPRWRR